jgi:hypothetical protein
LAKIAAPDDAYCGMQTLRAGVVAVIGIAGLDATEAAVFTGLLLARMLF